MDHSPPFRPSLPMTLALAALALAACEAKALKATKVDVGASRITNHKCNGEFAAAVDLATTYEAPPAPPARSYRTQVQGKATTGVFRNVEDVSDAEYSSREPAHAISVNGTQTDTCQDGTFQVTFAKAAGPDPKPSPVTVTVPALGHAMPGGIPWSAGQPKAFTAKFDLKNCAAAAKAFTVTAAAGSNVVADPAVAPAMPLNIGPGATRQITVTGSKVSEDQIGVYVVRVSAPGTIACAQQGMVE